MIDYQPQIDQYQNLFACSYLAKYNLDNLANKTFTAEDFPARDRLKLFYKMVTHCRGAITLGQSSQLIQSGFDYDDKFSSTMLETVRQLTNYGGFIRNKGALKLSGEDKETIDLMFEISKNEGERHGKMPTFGRTTGQPRIPNGEEFEAEEEVEVKKPAQATSKQAAKKGEEDLITIVDLMKDEAKPSGPATKKDAPTKSATKTPLASPAAKKVEEAKPSIPPKAQEEPKDEEEEESSDEEEEEDTRDNEEE